MNRKIKIGFIIVLFILFILVIIFILRKKEIPKEIMNANQNTGNKGGLNNPGNIRNSTTNWQGKITLPNQTFESFDTIANGSRALMKILFTYRDKYNLNTVSQIISRYAPPTENNTSTYINFVSGQLNVGNNDILPITKYPSLVSAISKMEGNSFVSISEAEKVYNNLV